MKSPKKSILIVEDQRLIAADLENTLVRIGYDVAGNVASGEEAIVTAMKVEPDLVLMDIRLRGAMDGIEAAEAIRTHIPVPVVYLTAYADEETILRAKATTPFGYLVKPFNERELRAAIEVAIYKHETDSLLAEERARRHAAEEFKLLVEGVADYAICMLDARGRVVTWNEGARRLTGYAAEEVLGRHISITYPIGDAAAGRGPDALLEQALREGRAEVEGLRLRKDGSRFWANVVITAIRDETGSLHGFGKITRDLTERRRWEEQREKLIEELKAAVRARDEFLQMASHELNTPLTPLQLQLDAVAQALGKAGLQNERLTHKLDSATRQTLRLRRLVESLLDVSRITADRIALDVERFDLAEAVRDVSERLHLEAEPAGSQIAVRADQPIVGSWDRLRFEQILSNLLSNAIKYGAGKPIEISTHVSDGTVRISVSDAGIGIEPDAMERIFGRFERAVSLRHYGGLGLGLFIARHLAEAHGGTIVAQRRAAAGSIFTVVLPLETVVESPVAPRAPEEPP